MTILVSGARRVLALASCRASRIVVGSALLSAATVLVCAWPAQTHAGDFYDTIDQEQAAQDEAFRDATQLGSLLVASRLVADESNPKRFFLEILARNTTGEGAESAEVDAVIERTVYSPMSRGAPPPTVAWKVKETMRVEPGKVAVRRLAVPAGLGFQIYKSQQPPKLNQYDMPIGPQTAYAANVQALTPAHPGAPAPSATQPSAATALGAAAK